MKDCDKVAINVTDVSGAELLKQALIEAEAEYLDKVLAEASDVEVPPIERDVTGTPICPGHPKICLGSGDFQGFECCCDECDYFLKCYPEYQKEVDEGLSLLRERKSKTSLADRLVGVLSSNVDYKEAREERAKKLLEEDPNA